MRAMLRALYMKHGHPGPDAPREAYRTSDELDRAWWNEYHARVFAALDVPADHLAEAADEMYAYFANPGDWEPYEETLPLLDELRDRNIVLGICSNWSSGLQRIIDGLGLREYFAFVYTSAEVGEMKPGHRMFELGLEATGLAPDQVIHVGDMYDADVVGAGRAGIRGVLVNRWQRAPTHADPVIPDLAALPALLV